MRTTNTERHAPRARTQGRDSIKRRTEPRVATHAIEIADAGDRLFLSVANRLGRLGTWARYEATIAADSAVAAFATTVGVVKKLAGATTPPSRAGDEGDDASRTSERGIDLVQAVAVSARPESLPDVDATGVLPNASARRSAGVVPLLQALGRTMASHAHQGYASLQQDERFWTLIHLLQLLGRPNIGCAPNEDETKPPVPLE